MEETKSSQPTRQKYYTPKVPFIVSSGINMMEFNQYKQFKITKKTETETEHCLYYHQGTDKYYRLAAKQNEGSMFIDEFVNEKSNVALITNYDPVFIALILIYITEDNTKYHFFGDILEEYDLKNSDNPFPQCLHTSKSLMSSFDRICSTTKVDADSVAYKYDQSKTIKELQSKHSKLVDFMMKRFTSDSKNMYQSQDTSDQTSLKEEMIKKEQESRFRVEALKAIKPEVPSNIFITLSKELNLFETLKQVPITSLKRKNPEPIKPPFRPSKISDKQGPMNAFIKSLSKESTGK